VDPIALAALVAFGSVVVLTPVVMAVARRFGVVDLPGGRKRHKRPIPLLGGVAVAAAAAAGLFAGGVAWEFRIVLAAAGGVFLVGLVDDLRSTPRWVRLLVEIVAASAVVASGLRATFLVGQVWITAPVTVIWIVAMTNAFNFLDNMDGLSSGIAAICAAMFLLVCLQTDQLTAAAALAAVAAAALGFLSYNFRPARVFLGDAGSLTLGFLLGTLSVAMTFYDYGRPTVLSLAAPALVRSLPVFHMVTVLWIRFREKRPLTRGDNSHFSHRLVALGMSERGAVLTMYLAATAIGLGATLLPMLSGDLSWLAGAVLLAQAAGVFGIVLLIEQAGSRKGGPDGNDKNIDKDV
jgi:UDP-GlcNAc:undecaprenyl-phosphate GlcNAc-1-phosphate transferase